jgi:hypothetical protein
VIFTSWRTVVPHLGAQLTWSSVLTLQIVGNLAGLVTVSLTGLLGISR